MDGWRVQGGARARGQVDCLWASHYARSARRARQVRASRGRAQQEINKPHNQFTRHMPLSDLQICYKSAQIACPNMDYFFLPWQGPYYSPIVNFAIYSADSQCCPANIPS